MNQRILFVDDDRSLLNMLERNFGLDYEVTTAECGPDALETIQSSDPFAAVMVDMRMPGMEGVELIEKARPMAPDSVFMMLTGNQDLTTAMEAVNRGQVFRFLNKPCQLDDITLAINAAMKQYDLVTGEKELLDKTFVGSVGMLTDIIESMESPLIESSQLVSTCQEVLQLVDVPPDWSIQLASKLLMVGLPLLHPDELNTLSECGINQSENRDVQKKMVQTSIQLVQRIPRLQPVVDILEGFWKATGLIRKEETGAAVYANVLSISFCLLLLQRRDEGGSSTLAEMRSRFPQLHETLIEWLENAIANDNPCLSGEAYETERIKIASLRKGMTVAKNVYGKGDVLLVARGRKLTTPMISRLIHLANLDELEIVVEETEEMPA